MTKLRVFLSLTLLAALLAACAPATSAVAPTQPMQIGATRTLPHPTPTLEVSLPATIAPAGTLAPTPLPVVTSRGPHLEATDPTTVNMASGGLQLVEFFEFW